MLLSLPYELLREVSCYLTPATLLALTRIRKSLLPLIRDPVLWQRRYINVFPFQLDCYLKDWFVKNPRYLPILLHLRTMFNRGQEELEALLDIIREATQNRVNVVFIEGVFDDPQYLSYKYLRCVFLDSARSLLKDDCWCINKALILELYYYYTSPTELRLYVKMLICEHPKERSPKRYLKDIKFTKDNSLSDVWVLVYDIAAKGYIPYDLWYGIPPITSTHLHYL